MGALFLGKSQPTTTGMKLCRGILTATLGFHDKKEVLLMSDKTYCKKWRGIKSLMQLTLDLDKDALKYLMCLIFAKQSWIAILNTCRKSPVSVPSYITSALKVSSNKKCFVNIDLMRHAFDFVWSLLRETRTFSKELKCRMQSKWRNPNEI